VDQIDLGEDPLELAGAVWILVRADLFGGAPAAHGESRWAEMREQVGHLGGNPGELEMHDVVPSGGDRYQPVALAELAQQRPGALAGLATGERSCSGSPGAGLAGVGEL